MPGDPRVANVCMNRARGEGDGKADTRGPWPEGEQWQFVLDPAAQVPKKPGEAICFTWVIGAQTSGAAEPACSYV